MRSTIRIPNMFGTPLEFPDLSLSCRCCDAVDDGHQVMHGPQPHLPLCLGHLADCTHSGTCLNYHILFSNIVALDTKQRWRKKKWQNGKVLHSKQSYYAKANTPLQVRDPSLSLSHYISTLVILLPNRDIYVVYSYLGKVLLYWSVDQNNNVPKL